MCEKKRNGDLIHNEAVKVELLIRPHSCHANGPKLSTNRMASNEICLAYMANAFDNDSIAEVLPLEGSWYETRKSTPSQKS